MINTPFEPNRSVASLTLGELENFIKQTIYQYNQQKLTHSEDDQPFDETVPSFLQIVTENADKIPDKLWETVPEDASENLDYYLYNIPYNIN
ncbi:hypothetical protein [Aphanothece sacrum]|uniref:Isocitrate dehydrogenase n=1 Tax=Aphanothece sacrum FPU1 TaxID=1920663 RepID=A0A401IEP6_APHSA|nr:hypothetical protein [Aphanothece sacrum]GBF79679.1 isocitrate dehydrogenase [Aphanothece sacrum FPU1]GBF87139.1 isocitrate dehydrogenase [Aphanothece sacrum FPU3]